MPRFGGGGVSCFLLLISLLAAALAGSEGLPGVPKWDRAVLCQRKYTCVTSFLQA